MKLPVVQTMALKNLQRRPVRSWCMIFFVFMLAASLFLSTVLVDSMNDGLEKTANRMGADVIVVPKEYEKDMADALFLGEMCNFTFDRQWIEPISQIDGIKAVSPQLYMQSLAASCCSAETQLIAFDPDTDFIVKAWLEDSDIPMPKRGEMIIGYLIDPEIPGQITFFDQDYTVVGQLEQTGSTYDVCVFMTYETAQDIMNSDKWLETFGTTTDATKLISSLMIRTEEGADTKKIARTINYNLDKASPVSAYTTNGIMTDAMDTVNSMTGYSTVLITLISILVVAALICIFTITINERTREFGVLAALGAGSNKLSGIVLSEGVMLGLAGGIIGGIFGAAFVYIFGGSIVTILELPKLNSNMIYLFVLGLKCLGLSLLVSVSASLYSAWKISRNNLDALIKGEEL